MGAFAYPGEAMPTDTTWLTAAQAAEHVDRSRRAITGGRAGVSLCVIKKWVQRKHLAPAGLDEKGHQLFRLADVAKAEQATRPRALVLARSTPRP